MLLSAWQLIHQRCSDYEHLQALDSWLNHAIFLFLQEKLKIELFESLNSTKQNIWLVFNWLHLTWDSVASFLLDSSLVIVYAFPVKLWQVVSMIYDN